MQERSVSTSVAPSVDRLTALRALMRTRGVGAVVVRSTDRFLNEYVATDVSTRVWLTGFTGSAGDALITGDRAVLCVDGRYTLQASQEAPAFEVRTAELGTSIEGTWQQLLAELPAAGVRVVAVEADRMAVSLYATIQKRAAELGLALVSPTPSLLEELRATAQGAAASATDGPVWAIPAALSGKSVTARIQDAAPAHVTAGVDAQLLTALDEIAWVANMRGLQFPEQATFRAEAVVLKDQGALVLALDARQLDGARGAPESSIQMVAPDGLVPALAAAAASRGAAGLRVGFDPSTTTEATRARLAAVAGVTLVAMASPFAKLRTLKTAAELQHMTEAFFRADAVVHAVKTWVCSQVARGVRVTERDVADKTRALFHDSGAFGLSFKVISAAGKNGAIIHYSTPDPNRVLKPGELLLLDTGAYYDGGLATDLTRTFLVGGPRTRATAEQKRLFTRVLQASIAGMSARIPVGAVGEQLDAIVRTPLWRAGLDYGHGTGHGVGVNVHEAPPRISVGSRVPLEVGQVFSIEPGIYLEGYGGVRIENLCTLVPDPVTPPKGVNRRFLRVKPLTFSPLDDRLIDRTLLTREEKAFLVWFKKKRVARKHAADLSPLGLPPLPHGAKDAKVRA